MTPTVDSTAKSHPIKEAPFPFHRTGKSKAKGFLLVQESLLRRTGFLPLCDKTLVPSRLLKCTSKAMAWMAMAFLVTNALYNFTTILRVFRKVASPNLDGQPVLAVNEGHEHWLHSLLYFLPDLTATGRGLPVLATMYYKRNRWAGLKQRAIEFVAYCFTDPDAERRLYRKIRLLSVGSIFITIVSYILWVSAAWTEAVQGLVANNDSLSYLEIQFYPFPIRLSLVQRIVLDSFFTTLPYILSQQAQLCGVFLVIILSEGLTRLREEIVRERENLGSLTTERVHRWVMIHARMMELIDEIGETFQVIFLLSYVLDFLNVIGSSAFFLNANMITSYWSYIYYTATFCMFGLYATALAYPLIQVVEKSATLPDALYLLTLTLEDHKQNQPTSERDSSKEISKRLRQFELSCRNHPLIFTGLKYVYFTRELLTRTWTLTVSFMILANELLK
ncbi:hypothetical protein BV898_19218 [Hypsibius exemplaris]|uniref:Uncharacterized protein n=1 Tax=Hypsibius exemplaris TaxID=2072580 RepID=A0A9X6NKG4_HYPEX|nr:hypothetical protein BV898_19218 [Hypsibius exemplaris]